MLNLEAHRRLIPRWRSSVVTICTGELDGLVRIQHQQPPSIYLQEKLVHWESEHSIESAAELVAGVLVENQPNLGIDAAKFLLSARDATQIVKGLAQKMLAGADNGSLPCSENAILRLGQEDQHGVIRVIRRRLIDFPQNALLWVDLARAYTILGHSKQASRAMDVALALQPGNRFVLRSAARMYLHGDQAERAHFLLQRSESTRSDPWLISAEISAAMIIGRTSRLIKPARNLLMGFKGEPLQIAELAGSLATVDLCEGAFGSARKLFKRSLVQPTENSVAQAEWASKIDKDVSVSSELLKVPLSFEARALHDFRMQRWSGVIKHSAQWLKDEPFSTRPAHLASYVAAEALDDFKLCEKWAREGLKSNPDDWLLSNNLVYALTCQGQYDDANRVLGNIVRHGSDHTSDSVLLATEGLLRFREGNAILGRALYTKAIESSRKGKLTVVSAIAAIRLAREEVLARSAEMSRAVALAQEECRHAKDSEANRLLASVIELYKRTKKH